VHICCPGGLAQIRVSKPVLSFNQTRHPTPTPLMSILFGSTDSSGTIVAWLPNLRLRHHPKLTVGQVLTKGLKSSLISSIDGSRNQLKFLQLFKISKRPSFRWVRASYVSQRMIKNRNTASVQYMKHKKIPASSGWNFGRIKHYSGLSENASEAHSTVHMDLFVSHLVRQRKLAIQLL
jgi:hypothetical protein